MNTTQREKIGQEIRRQRTRMKLTQKQFGALIGKSESRIGEYENGTANMTLDTFFKIASVCKLKPETLIKGIPQEEKPDEEKWDAELRIYGMEDRKAVMTILAVNGYDVGQHKKKVTQTGKTVDYYVHATDRKGNADTSK